MHENIKDIEIPYSFCSERFYQHTPPIHVPEYAFDYDRDGGITDCTDRSAPQDEVAPAIPDIATKRDTDIILQAVCGALCELKEGVEHVSVFWSFVQKTSWYERVKDMSSKLIVTGVVFLAALKLHSRQLKVLELCEACRVTPPTVRKALNIFKEFV